MVAVLKFFYQKFARNGFRNENDLNNEGNDFRYKPFMCELQCV